MRFTINDTVYTIDEFAPGEWFWSGDTDSKGVTFPDHIAALQDAIRHEQAVADERDDDDTADRNYRNEVTAFYDRRDYQ